MSSTANPQKRSRERTPRPTTSASAARPKASASADERLEFGDLALELLRLRALLEKPRPGRRALLAPFEVRSRVVHYLFQRTQQGATMTDVAFELGLDISQLCRWRKQQRQALEEGKVELSRAVQYSTPGCASFLSVDVDTSGAHDALMMTTSAREAVEPESPGQTQPTRSAPDEPSAPGRHVLSIDGIGNASPPAGGLTVVTPSGYRVEGLSLDAVCTLLMRLAC